MLLGPEKASMSSSSSLNDNGVNWTCTKNVCPPSKLSVGNADSNENFGDDEAAPNLSDHQLKTKTNTFSWELKTKIEVQDKGLSVRDEVIQGDPTADCTDKSVVGGAPSNEVLRKINDLHREFDYSAGNDNFSGISLLPFQTMLRSLEGNPESLKFQLRTHPMSGPESSISEEAFVTSLTEVADPLKATAHEIDISFSEAENLDLGPGSDTSIGNSNTVGLTKANTGEDTSSSSSSSSTFTLKTSLKDADDEECKKLMNILTNSNHASKKSDLWTWDEKLPLRPEQQRVVAWMQKRERGVEEKYIRITARKYAKIKIQNVQVLLDFELSSLYRASGGLLADKVGFGKTASFLALVAAQHNQNLIQDGESLNNTPLIDGYFDMRNTTLVMVPSSLLGQWDQEIDKFLGSKHGKSTKGKPRVLRMDNVSPLKVNISKERLKKFLSSYDIIVCTYRVLYSEVYSRRLNVILDSQITKKERKKWKKNETDEWQQRVVGEKIRKATEKMVQHYNKSSHDKTKPIPGPSTTDATAGTTVSDAYILLHQCHFGRICLDEFHNCSELTWKAGRLLSLLRSDVRWGLTGTPPVASVNDVRFLSSCLFGLDILGGQKKEKELELYETMYQKAKKSQSRALKELTSRKPEDDWKFSVRNAEESFRYTPWNEGVTAGICEETGEILDEPNSNMVMKKTRGKPTMKKKSVTGNVQKLRQSSGDANIKSSSSSSGSSSSSTTNLKSDLGKSSASDHTSAAAMSESAEKLINILKSNAAQSSSSSGISSASSELIDIKEEYPSRPHSDLSSLKIDDFGCIVIDSSSEEESPNLKKSEPESRVKVDVNSNSDEEEVKRSEPESNLNSASSNSENVDTSSPRSKESSQVASSDSHYSESPSSKLETSFSAGAPEAMTNDEKKSLVLINPNVNVRNRHLNIRTLCTDSRLAILYSKQNICNKMRLEVLEI